MTVTGLAPPPAPRQAFVCRYSFYKRCVSPEYTVQFPLILALIGASALLPVAAGAVRAALPGFRPWSSEPSASLTGPYGTRPLWTSVVGFSSLSHSTRQRHRVRR